MILHVDMDAFYASVEERDRPELVGQPVIVGGTPEGRGVVAAANYVVRKYGVHSAMPAATAKRLCPHAIVLPPRLDYYAEISEQIREILLSFTPLVEPLSLDEAFLDVSPTEHLFGSAIEIGRQIKQRIRDELQLVASVGLAPNKFLAKIASDLEKPDGLVVVEPTQVREFLDPLPVGKLWGVGRVTGEALERLGVSTIGQVRALSPDVLRQHFGEHGEHLWQLAHGHDEREVIPDREAKSISHETTFARNIEDREVLQACLVELAEQVAWRLRRRRIRGRTVHLKLRFDDFRTITRAVTLAAPTDITHEIQQAAAKLFLERVPAGRISVRLLGVGVSGFDNPQLVQKMLFEDAEHTAHAQLDKAADQIRERFGASALGSASRLLPGVQHRPGLDEGGQR